MEKLLCCYGCEIALCKSKDKLLHRSSQRKLSSLGSQDLQVEWRLCCVWHSFWSSTHHEPGPLCSWPAEFCPDQASLADAQQLLLIQSCLPQERKYVTNSKREVTPFQLTHYQSSLCHQHCKSLRHLQAAGSCAEQEQCVNRAMGLGDAQGGCKHHTGTRDTENSL